MHTHTHAHTHTSRHIINALHCVLIIAEANKFVCINNLSIQYSYTYFYSFASLKGYLLPPYLSMSKIALAIQVATYQQEEHVHLQLNLSCTSSVKYVNKQLLSYYVSDI